jgi:S1-C subfamily serine protease
MLKVEKKRIVGLRRGILLVLAVLVLAGCSADGEGGAVETSEEIYQDNSRETDGLINAASAVVGINSDSYRGCGVIYEKNEDYLVILTAAHVLENASEVTVTFNDGLECKSDRILKDDETDCGFIAVAIQDVGTDAQTNAGTDAKIPVTKNRNIFDNIPGRRKYGK